jgi:hypothetical protein
MGASLPPVAVLVLLVAATEAGVVAASSVVAPGAQELDVIHHVLSQQRVYQMDQPAHLLTR